MNALLLALERELARVTDAPQAWITGGAEIFRLALPRAQMAVVSEIDADYEGDVFAPQLGDNWHEVGRERHVSAAGLPPSLHRLLSPEAYPHPVPDVRLVTTHISWILLTGELAYKIKRPVLLPFVDLREPVRRASVVLPIFGSLC